MLKSPRDVPSVAEYAKLLAFLARNGLTLTKVRQAVGSAVGKRTRGEIKETVKQFLVSKK